MHVMLARIGLATLNVAVFFIEEVWTIAMVAIFPLWVAIIAVSGLCSFFSISCTYLCGASNLSPMIRQWLDKKEKEKEESHLVQWAVRVAHGVTLFSSFIVAIAIGPTTAALILHQAGIRQWRAYVVDVFYSVISGTIWCLIYGLGINLLKIAYDFIRNLMIGG